MNAFSRMILWALTGLLFPLQIASAQDHQITLFRHNHPGAVTIGFDDGLTSQVTNAVPLLNAKGLKATFFVVTGSMDVTWDNQRTLYAPGRDGRWQRATLVSGQPALDVLTIDPATGEFRRERYALSPSAYAAAVQALGSATVDGCNGDAARSAAAHRNETLLRFTEGQPIQRQVWRCGPTAGVATTH